MAKKHKRARSKVKDKDIIIDRAQVFLEEQNLKEDAHVMRVGGLPPRRHKRPNQTKDPLPKH